MPAAAPGTETLSIARQDGTALAVTLHYDPATRDWADPAVDVAGDGGGVLYLDPGDGGGAVMAVQAEVPVPAAVLAALGFPARTDQLRVTLLASVPQPGTP